MDYANVLVPLDGSELAERALDPAAAIARRMNVPIVLYSQADQEGRAADREGYLEEVVARLEGVQTSVHGDVAPSPALGIEQLASGLERPLVCMSSHGRGGLGEALLGSVAEETLRRVRAPVVLIGPACRAERSPVEGPLVASVDGSKVSEAILEPAQSWAAACDMPMFLVQVVSDDWESEVAAAGVDPGDVREDSYLRGIARRIKDQPSQVNWDVLRHRDPKQPADKLVAYLAEKEVGLMTMSTHGRTGLRRLVIGSVAMRVVHQSPCPVLVVRPPNL
jgi:nucleotide-binding universal stress UspA family protein